MRRISIVTAVVLLVNFGVGNAQQVQGKVNWEGLRYDLTNNISPYDSVRTALALPQRIGGLEDGNREAFLKTLGSVYHEMTVERVTTPNGLVQRYVIPEDGSVTVLEKESNPIGLVLYFMNGRAVTEMKFYKILTAHYDE